MPTLRTSYLVPAILLNPAVVLHLINTFASYLVPPLCTTSHSPRPFLESLGPLPNSTPYLDMHADEQLCWRYTIAMVIVQIFAVGRIQDNREKRKSARAAKAEKERLSKERLRKEHEKSLQGRSRHTATPMTWNGGCSFDGVVEVIPFEGKDTFASGNGVLPTKCITLEVIKAPSETEDSLTETSEEEVIL